MLVTASIAGDFAAFLGLWAGAIAVFGFLAQAYPALSGASDRELRRYVSIGGLIGLAIGSLVILLSATVG
ncbi:MAG TPA: hypothetical protein VG898_09765 [Solirubrobacterales bacterium]|nr:hypothetical protein [Solirubrobacterales bacterium]